MGESNGARGPAAASDADARDAAERSANDGTDGDEQPLPGPPADEIIGGMDDDAPRAFNLYRNKKLISHGLMNVALFSANANQLRYVFETDDGSAVFVISIVLLLVSIFLQISIGVALLLSARYNVTDPEQRKMAFRLGNYVVVGIFLVTVVNIFITSFGGPTVVPPTTTLLPSTAAAAVAEPTVAPAAGT